MWPIESPWGRLLLGFPLAVNGVGKEHLRREGAMLRHFACSITTFSLDLPPWPSSSKPSTEMALLALFMTTSRYLLGYPPRI